MSQLIAKMKQFTRQGLVGFSALAICIAPMTGPALARAKVGVASAVIPQARLGDTAEALEIISVGDRVNQDVLIETGQRGRTQVLFVDGSSMNIGPSSRIVIDEFVFDPAQLSGNLGARIEKGSMRFIGGVLSKREDQVKFNAGEATVGIRGGIAKIALGGDGKLKAELVHGRLSVVTPEGIFETDRIGTLIERGVEGGVVTRSITAEEAKEELDEEAKESLIEVKKEEENQQTSDTETPAGGTNAPDDEVAATDEATPGDTPLDADIPADAEPAVVDDIDATTAQADDGSDAPAAASRDKATGDVLVDNPVENGLVQIGADGKLEATVELTEIDPDAAKLINEGGVAIDENGQIVPTARMLQLDPTAQAMFDEGLLEVDENGFLVTSRNYDPDGFYEEVSFQETEDKLVSDATLKEFGFEEVEALTNEDLYKSNLTATRTVLSTDETTAKLYEVGQLEIDENGLLKPSANFDPLLAARAEQAVAREKISFVDDSAADKLLLNSGVFDTKITTRVIGADLATSFYSAEVTKIISADIVRDDAVNAITKLAAANGLSVPDDIKEKDLDDLVSLGGALSTRDAFKASIGAGTVNYDEPLGEVDVTDDGKVVLRTTGIDGKIEEIDTEAALVNLVSGEIDLASAGKFLSGEELVRLLPNIDPQKDEGPKDDVTSSALPGLETVGDDGKTERGFADLGDFAANNIIDSAQGEGIIGIDGKIDTRDFDDRAKFVPSIDLQTRIDEIIDSGKDNFIGGLGDEFAPINLKVEETGSLTRVGIENEDKNEISSDDKNALVTDQIENEKGQQAEKIAGEQASTLVEVYQLSMAGQRLAKNSIWGSGAAMYWSAYSSAAIAGAKVSSANDLQANAGQPNHLILYGNGQVRMALQAVYAEDDFDQNVVAMSIVEMGSATSLLARHNMSFKHIVDAAVIDMPASVNQESSNTLAQNFVTNNPDILQVRTSVDICECDQISTGIWSTEDFTDKALSNLSYRHKSHWAIGAPLSSDTIKALAGMMASFEGHAYGTVANAAGSSEGFGEVTVGLDFANPSDLQRNYFELRNFQASNLDSPVTGSTYLQQVYDANDEFSGRYVGGSGNMLVDGGVHGTIDNLQTAGTFTLNTRGDVAISGSYAAQGTVEESPPIVLGRGR